MAPAETNSFFYRGIIRLTGIPLHLTRALLKLGELTDTQYERRPVEIFVNLMRALVVVPIAAWSLLNQWATSGHGRKTDDDRTNAKGIVPEGAPDSFADWVEPNKGDRNMLIRSVMEFAQMFFSVWLVCYRIDTFHMILQGMCELVTSMALFYQWKYDHASTHYVRAFVSLTLFPSFLHLGLCGHGTWPWDHCDTNGWSDIRRPFRALMFLAAIRMLLNAVSLVCQNLYPRRGVTPNYGHEQLLFRSIIRFSGIPLYLAITMQALADFEGTEWERAPLELVVQLIRALVILPILCCSLAHQWRFTGTDHGGRSSITAKSAAAVKDFAAQQETLESTKRELAAAQMKIVQLEAEVEQSVLRIDKV